MHTGGCIQEDMYRLCANTISSYTRHLCIWNLVYTGCPGTDPMWIMRENCNMVYKSSSKMYDFSFFFKYLINTLYIFMGCWVIIWYTYTMCKDKFYVKQMGQNRFFNSALYHCIEKNSEKWIASICSCDLKHVLISDWSPQIIFLWSALNYG